MAELRRRRQHGANEATSDDSKYETVEVKEEELSTKNNDETALAPVPPADLTTTTAIPSGDVTTTWLVTKWVLLRSVGIVYLIAFLGAHYQNKGLMGSQGLQPATEYFDPIQQKFASPWDGFQQYPSLFWWMDLTDDNLQAVYMSGMVLSALVTIGGGSGSGDSMIVLALLWLLYFSIITSAGGTSFYAYGWESQLLETGFLSIFLCDNVFPTLNIRRRKASNSSASTPPSPVVLWLFRWLCFRISIGAGLIKIRGDSCWTEKTCLHYHFETQPIPSPTSFFFHFLPKWALTHAVDLDLFVQVYTSWMVLCPTFQVPGCKRLSKLLLSIVRLGGFVQVGFMFNIIFSGNFAFLNHLTVIPALACLDDACWPQWMRRQHYLASQYKNTLESSTKPSKSMSWLWKAPRRLIDLGLVWLIGSLSRPVVENLLQIGGRRQQMNASFGSFRLVNTYGAFGSVGQGRYEPIISITYNNRDWIELEFPCKPGTLTRRPCFCAPYHYRLDWNIWFIGFKPHGNYLRGRESWMFALIAKLLDSNKKSEDRPWLDLLDTTSAQILRENYNNKFMTPLYAKVDMYHYQMAAPLWEILPTYLKGEAVVWWNRTFEEVLMPSVKLDLERGRLVVASTS